VVRSLTLITQPKPKAGQAKGRSWAGPKGPVREAGAPNKFYDTNHLAAVLGGHDTSPYELDKGQRNDEPLEDGYLNHKLKSNVECKGELLSKYGCRKCGMIEKGAMCYIPASGEYKGKHIRMEGGPQMGPILLYMVSLFSSAYI